MGKKPTELTDDKWIREMFVRLPGSRIPAMTDICDILLHYTVMVEIGFATERLMNHAVEMWSLAGGEWSTLFQSYGVHDVRYLPTHFMLRVKNGDRKQHKKCMMIFWHLGWIKGLDTTEEDSILLEQVAHIEELDRVIIDTFLINRSLLRGQWAKMFEPDFRLYRPHLEG